MYIYICTYIYIHTHTYIYYLSPCARRGGEEARGAAKHLASGGELPHAIEVRPEQQRLIPTCSLIPVSVFHEYNLSPGHWSR